jgi:hypothetical protein
MVSASHPRTDTVVHVVFMIILRFMNLVPC